MKYNISLGVDIGTSKISVASYTKNTKALDLVLVGDTESFFPDKYDEYVEPSIVVFGDEDDYPLFGREGDLKLRDGAARMTIHSLKKCVFCEWFYQSSQIPMAENNCHSLKNYQSDFWCKKGAMDFMIGDYDWKPGALFQQQINYIFDKSARNLQQKFENYSITELKLAFPMLFYEGGPFYEEQLKSLIKRMAQVTFGPHFDDNCEVFVIEEPIASLMAHCGDDFQGIVPDGYFLIIDVGAGTTDLALCLKKDRKISTLYTRSIPLAGDDYDHVIKKLIAEQFNMENLKGDINYISKDIKEGFCKTGIIHTKDHVGQRIKIKKVDIDKEFAKLNQKILKKVKNVRQHLTQRQLDLNVIFLSGGGTNNKSLREEITKLAREGKAIPVKNLQLRESSLNKMYDSKIVGVSLGAAIPYQDYISLIKYSLPVNILLLYRDKEGNEKTIKIYEADSEKSKSTKTLKDVQSGASIKLLVESRQGSREILNSFSVPHFGAKRRLESMVLSYDVNFNGKTRILVKYRYKGATGGQREKEIEVFNSYPHWKLRKQLV